MPNPRKKLIEVSLPLEAINRASAHEKAVRHGHPANVHRWWARRPQAAARAVIFAQMVDDPSGYVDELLADPVGREAAERAHRARLKAWEERKAAYENARTAGLEGPASPEPGARPVLEETAAGLERERLFHILEQLVRWENTTNAEIFQAARDEIWRSWRRACNDHAGDPAAKALPAANDLPGAEGLYDPRRLPAFHDPFAGGGALPLEAQRLGLESCASDLNPVAVVINKAMLEIPPRFAGRPPVNPESQKQKTFLAGEWQGTRGLAEDVRYYGQWIRDQAEKRVGRLYPQVEVSAEMADGRPDLAPYTGQKRTVIAWLWARTVKSPNPAFAHVDVPLISSYMLAVKAGKEAYVEPVITGDSYSFTVKMGRPANLAKAKHGTKLARGANFQCILSGSPIASGYIYREAKAGRMGARLMAVVADGERGRIYLPPSAEMEAAALPAEPGWKPTLEMPENPRWFSPPLYGLKTYGDIFAPRQLAVLTAFSDLVQDARDCVLHDALAAGFPADHTPLKDGGRGAAAYADAVAVYIALAVSKTADSVNSLCPWEPAAQCPRQLFGRQAVPMLWDYAEANPFCDSSGGLMTNVKGSTRAFETFAAGTPGFAEQQDAASQSISLGKVVSTDPPYYDNIGYADLSDFFYIWLRRSLQPIFPELFTAAAAPKTAELIALPSRHGGKEQAENFFLDGMTQAMRRLAEQAHPAFPVTIYYAFKQTASRQPERLDAGGAVSTGWETFLGAVISAGFALTGAWPMRTEMTAALKDRSNSLASSIVLVCRPRPAQAPTVPRLAFVTALREELPSALAHLQAGSIAPVDLAQAAIGPGMVIYTRYARVLDGQGQPLTVRQALALINQAFDEVLAGQESGFDPGTRWALAWFEQNGFSEGANGMAEALARAKDTHLGGIAGAGILATGHGKVRLLRPRELPEDWNPTAGTRLTAWEMVHHLIRAQASGGERGAAELLARLGAQAETARVLCYHLYTICERKKRPAEALSYNALVQEWPEIARRKSEQSISEQSISQSGA